MNNIATVLYIAAASISTFCLLLLFVCRHHIRHFPRYLIAFIAVECVSMVLTLLLHADAVPVKNLWLFLLSTTAYFSSPLLRLYAQEVNTGKPPAHRYLWPWQIITIIAGIILCSPLLLLVTIGGHLDTRWYIHSAQFWAFYYGSLVLAAGIYLFQVTFNIYCSYQCLPNTNQIPAKTTSRFWPSADDSPSNAAVKIVLLGMALHLLVNITRAAQCKLVGVPSLASLTLSLLDIVVTLALLLAVLRTMLQQTLSQVNTSQVGILARTVDKYQRSALSTADRARIKQKLLTALQNNELIHDHSLNLRKLAQALAEKQHYVSQVINQDLHSSFFDLVNAARIDSAAALLQNQPHLAIVDLAIAVGFNSKSTFYSAFAKHKGMTPTQYRNENTRPANT